MVHWPNAIVNGKGTDNGSARGATQAKGNLTAVKGRFRQARGAIDGGTGGAMLHTSRQLVNDDEKWREILRGLNQTFWHQTVMGKPSRTTSGRRRVLT